MFPFVFGPTQLYAHQPRHHYSVQRRVNPYSEIHQIGTLIGTLANLIESDERERSEHLSAIMYNEQGDMSMRCQTAGFKPDELSVDLDGDLLTVLGEHVESKEGESIERKFRRVIRLPKKVDQTKIKCELDENGELLLHVPRKEPIKSPKQNIPIGMKKSETDK